MQTQNKSLREVLQQTTKPNTEKTKKSLKSDKNALADYIESITFNSEVPEMENTECEVFLDLCHSEVIKFKNELLNRLKNI